jgi:beta-xylosidase
LDILETRQKMCHRLQKTMRTEPITHKTKDELTNDLKTCNFHSPQSDECTRVVHTLQLAVMNRVVFSDNSTNEEIHMGLPLKGKTGCGYIYTS